MLLLHECSRALITPLSHRFVGQGLAGKTFSLGARMVKGSAVMYAVPGVKNGPHDAHVTVFYGDASEHSKF